MGLVELCLGGRAGVRAGVCACGRARLWAGRLQGHTCRSTRNSIDVPVPGSLCFNWARPLNGRPAWLIYTLGLSLSDLKYSLKTDETWVIQQPT